MFDKVTVIDRKHKEMLVAIIATKPEFLVTKGKMLVASAIVSVAISSYGMVFEILCLCRACILVKGNGQIGPLSFS